MCLAFRTFVNDDGGIVRVVVGKKGHAAVGVRLCRTSVAAWGCEWDSLRRAVLQQLLANILWGLMPCQWAQTAMLSLCFRHASTYADGPEELLVKVIARLVAQQQVVDDSVGRVCRRNLCLTKRAGAWVGVLGVGGWWRSEKSEGVSIQ